MAITAIGLPAHGGDLLAAEARWGRPAAGWLDLSTGINPHPYPLPPIAPAAWHRLPGSAEELELRRVAAGFWHVPSPEHVVTAAGSQPLIQALPHLAKPGQPVRVLAPTYAEHSRAWAAAGFAVSEIASLDQAGSGSILVVVNPNNPDGRTVAPARLLDIADAMAATGGLLVVDEAFGDVRPELSTAGQSRPGLVVLRSFGKFHGLAGLRLGFALAEPDLAEKLRARLGPWAVSGPALAVGRVALADQSWAENARRDLAATAARLALTLAQAGLGIVGGTSLFVLARHAEAATLYDRLGRAGILVRAFAEHPDWLRFGIPGDDGALQRLGRALAS